MNKKLLFYQLSVFLTIVAILLVIGQFRQGKISFNQGVGAQQSSQESGAADRVEVFYFHGTLRCPSCMSLEKYSRETVEEYFAKELASGRIIFREINVDFPENKDLAAKFQATGSSLYVNAIYGGDERIEEVIEVWRYIGNEAQFKDVLKNKLGKLFAQ